MTNMRAKSPEVVVRPFDAATDLSAAESIEELCDVGPSGKMSLHTHLLGDPLARIRHSPAFLMLVAETCGPDPEIVGLVRGCIKTVTCGTKKPHHGRRGGGGDTSSAAPVYTKLAYILGLRVSPSHRRMGIALKLVMKLEEWFRSMGAEYAYMATDPDNEASVRLFTARCGFTKFRTPSILVHPVFAGHPLPLHLHRRRFSILKLSPSAAELLYRSRLSSVEFFPRDIDAVLNNPLSIGTFLAVDRSQKYRTVDEFLTSPPDSWAVLSVWNCRDVFRLELKGAGSWWRRLAAASRVIDKAIPWLRVPSVPDLFRPFGVCLAYGIGGEGPAAGRMVRALFGHAHNVARGVGCGVVAAEVAACEPLRGGIPHWRRLSCEEDLWCVKRLADDYSDGAVGDWTKAPPGKSIFVDPREF